MAWKDHAHFYASAAKQLRRVLLDHARRAHSDKRGGQVVILSPGEFDVGDLGLDARLLALNEALANLEALDPRAAKVVELRFFGGICETDAAEVLGISVATLKRDWDFAKNVAGRGTRVNFALARKWITPGMSRPAVPGISADGPIAPRRADRGPRRSRGRPATPDL